MIQNLLFIYQQEHYDAVRFLQFVYTNLNWFSFQKRQRLDKTIKIKLLIALVYVVVITTIVLCVFLIPNPFMKLLALVLLFMSMPFVVVLANILISPIVYFAKAKRVRLAKTILNKNRPIVVGITGSYGKSSLKEILATSLRGAGAKVMVTPGNINTTMGVAQYIIDNKVLVADVEYLILEMGAYKKGNIRETASFVSPDFSFLTAVGPVHLERFGSQEKIIQAKAELLQETTKHFYVNKDAGHTEDSAALAGLGKCTFVSNSDISQVEFLPNYKGFSFVYQSETYSTQLLARHNTILLGLAIAFMKDRGYPHEDIQKGIAKTVPFQHRLEPTYNKTTDVWVLDDSYNGNKAGFISALEVLGRASGRKIVLTPGIVELGPLTKQTHEEVAQKYIEELDLVLLIKSVGTKYIAEYFKKHNFVNYQVFDTAPEAHEALGGILKKGDTILFSNDLTDNYT